MKHRISFLLIMTLFLGCVSRSSTKVEIGSADSYPEQLLNSPHDVTFWDALQIGYLDVNCKSENETAFVDALKKLMNGDIKDAVSAFQILADSKDDSLLSKYSNEILLNLFFDQSLWGDLQKSLPDTGTGSKMGKLLSETYKNVPAESYDFRFKTKVPLIVKLGIPSVEVKINGKVKRFLLDTGAGLSVISSDVAEECGVHSLTTSSNVAGTGTSKQVAFHPTIIDSLLLGGLIIRNHPAMIIDKKDMHIKVLGIFTVLKIEGIIGWNAIKNMDLEIDFNNELVSVRQPKRIESDKKNLFWLGYPLISTTDKNGVPLIFGIDTGAKRSSITHNILKKISTDSVITKKIEVSSAGGSERISSKIIPALDIRLNEHMLHFTNIGTTASKSSIFFKRDGVLGSDIAAGRIMRIDYLNGLFEIK